ncbi:MAG: Ig-like domain-containing protein [Pseudomonadota bacterium]
MRFAPACAMLMAAFAGGASAEVCPQPASGETEIYPSAAVLPANLLRAYLYFPRPMGRGDILEHIALRDASGADVPGAFLGTRYTLWSQDRQRLTLLFDPGRVKTGLAAHDALGRALQEGARYTLVVRGSAQDSQGCPLGADIVHGFAVGPADLTAPDPRTWSLTLPSQGSTAPLSVDLGEPHDHLSLAYRLRVVNGEGAPVAGRIDLERGERVWRFTPRNPWAAQSYTLTIDPSLEDLAGNRPGVVFDRPVGEDAAEAVAALPFRPAAAPE